MKIKELQEKLAQWPDDTIVEVRFDRNGGHDNFTPIENVHEDYIGTIVLDIG